MSWRDNYEAVLNSQHWRNLKEKKKYQCNNRCESCKGMSSVFHLHHMHYKSLGVESIDDVEFLCPSCHKTADKEREQRTRNRRYEARVNGWGKKKYGYDWEQYYDWCKVSAEFDEWLENQ